MPVLVRTKNVYKTWQHVSDSFPKPFRFGLGGKIENLFLEILEIQFLATFSQQREKIELITKCVIRLDVLKFFMQISWENKHLKEKIYIPISKELDQIGREVSSWKKFLGNKNSRKG